jgi:hypothetical protein
LDANLRRVESVSNTKKTVSRPVMKVLKAAASVPALLMPIHGFETCISSTKTVIFVLEKVFCLILTSFSGAVTCDAVPDTTFFATEKSVSVVETIVGEAPAIKRRTVWVVCKFA